MKKIHAIIIHPQDNVATLCEDAKQGDSIQAEGNTVELQQNSCQGHKIALTELAKGMKIIKYNSIIGTCTQNICAGEWVHRHNLKSDYMKTSGGAEHDRQ